jgi:hypothetical protein
LRERQQMKTCLTTMGIRLRIEYVLEERESSLV